MSYYIRDKLPVESVFGTRRPTINEFFLSSYTLSVYNGCEFGCPYCDGWAYNPQSFSEAVRVPLDLPQRLAEELNHIDRGDMIAITALSDPYQPAEQTYRITRQVLQRMADAGQPCLVLTKSPLVLEDIPVLQQINQRSLAIVMTTLLTVDRFVSERIEGKAPLPVLRLEMLSQLKRAGIPVGVAMVPIIPYVNDTDYVVRKVLKACAERGVDFVVWDYLYMPNKQHHIRIGEMLAHLGSYPNSYYRDIYGEQQLPNAQYRAERNLEILRRCDQIAIQTPAPHRLYAGKLNPVNEAALLLKHTAFRNALQGQHRIADMHRELADLVYRGEATPEKLGVSPLWHTIRPILGYDV
jgi:DNA repair photolyase